MPTIYFPVCHSESDSKTLKTRSSVNHSATTRQEKVLPPFAPPGGTTRHRFPLDRRRTARRFLRPVRRRLPFPAHFSFRRRLRLGRVLDNNDVLAAAATPADDRSTANAARTGNPGHTVLFACAIAVLARRLLAGVPCAPTSARVPRCSTGSVHMVTGACRRPRGIAAASWGTWICSHVPKGISRCLTLSWYGRSRDGSRQRLAVGAWPGILARRTRGRSRCRI